MDSFSPVICQYTFTAQLGLRAIKPKSVNESITKMFPQIKYQARRNVEVFKLMLKYEALHKVTEQIFTDTPTRLVLRVSLSPGLG